MEFFVPPPKEERLSEESPACLKQFDKLIFCITFRGQSRKMYEHGKFGGCDPYFENVSWCMKMKLGNQQAKQRYQLRKRQVYHNVDKLPFEPKKQYLIHLLEENRLPARLIEQVEKDS